MSWKIAYIDNNSCQAAGETYFSERSQTYCISEFAAAELKKYLEMIDNNLEIAVLSFTAYRKDLDHVLWIGVSEELSGFYPKVDNAEFDDAIGIEVTDGRGVITGSNERSVLIAVYRFLREFGCYWARPGKDGEFICKKQLSDNPVPISVSVKEKASLRHRGITIEGAVSYKHVADMIEWLPRVGMNAYFNQFFIPFTFYERWYTHKLNPFITPENISVEEVKGILRQTINEIKKRGLLYHTVGHGWTCEPFGIPGDSWDVRKYDVPEETRKYFALINGERELFKGIPLCTNMCYSDNDVQKIIVEAITEYCKANKQVDYLHVWLGDSVNSQCECERCGSTRPSDLYVNILNEIDKSLTANKLPVKIVFLLYLDLLWEPLKEVINNQDRFVMMFAPITRTYTNSLSEVEEFDQNQLPPFNKNKIVLPESVDENLAWMKNWQKMCKGDSFIFDYHYMWDHFKDPGYYSMAKVLLNDIKSYHKLGLNGLLSCQLQRVFFPTALGMVIMAEALWNTEIDFVTSAADYFTKAFGDDGYIVKKHMEDISDYFDPPYLRNEKPVVDIKAAEKFASTPDKIKSFESIIEKNLASNLPQPMHLNWEYLGIHAQLCKLLSGALSLRASGDTDGAGKALEETFMYAAKNEKSIENVFDFYEFKLTMERVFENNTDS